MPSVTVTIVSDLLLYFSMPCLSCCALASVDFLIAISVCHLIGQYCSKEEAFLESSWDLIYPTQKQLKSMVFTMKKEWEKQPFSNLGWSMFFIWKLKFNLLHFKINVWQFVPTFVMFVWKYGVVATIFTFRLVMLPKPKVFPKSVELSEGSTGYLISSLS